MADNMPDYFSDHTSAYIKWLQTVGIKISPSVEIVDLRHHGKGRGVIATRNITAGEDLFIIPASAILTVHTSTLYKISEIFRDIVRDQILDPWMSLILALLHETALNNSKWQAYLAQLPSEDQFDTLMFWTVEQLAEFQASHIVSKIGRQSAESTFRDQIFPIVRSDPHLFGYASITTEVAEKHLMSRLHVLASTVMAYAFDIELSNPVDNLEDLPMEHEEITIVQAMVPLADVLNADGDRNNAKLCEESDGFFIMRAIKDIECGDEILNDYGPLPRADLLRRYGFVTDRYAAYDTVEIPTSIFIDKVHKLYAIEPKMIENLLEQHYERWTDGVPDAFEISRSDVPDFKPMDLFPWIYDLQKSRYAHQGPFKDDISSSMYLVSVLSQRRSEFGTSIDQDRTYLQELLVSEHTTSNRRAFMAIAIRIAEKEILEQAIDICKHASES